MTCIVGAIEEGRIILGADSAASCDHEIYRMQERKVFRNGPYVIGVTGSYKIGELLRFKAQLPEPPTDPTDLKPFFVRHLMPKIAGIVRAEGAAHDGRLLLGPRTGLLLGCRGKLWHVDPDLTVLCEGNFASIGSGRLRAYAALYVLEKAGVGPAKRRVELALEAAAEYTASVRGPWQFVELSAEDR